MNQLALFLALTFLFVPTGHASPRKAERPTTHSEVAEKREDLQALRGQIENLRKDVAANEDKHSSAIDQLKAVEQDISATQRGLHQLATQRQNIQETLRSLRKELKELETRLDLQQDLLAKLITHQYMLGNPDAVRLMLDGANPNQLSRDRYYLGAIAQARRELLNEYETMRVRKRLIADDTRARADELTAIEAHQAEQHGQLLAQREQRQRLAESISARISRQRKEIGALERSEKQLAEVITRLSRAQASHPAAPREPVATRRKLPTSESGQTAPSTSETVPDAAAGALPRLKGNLKLPVRGVVANRFGTPRQEGGSWKGLFIRAASGAEVKSVAAGRVVFADWMRGFGNLLIIDHGEQYLAVYGNNEALLKQNGDSVRGGETIATVGNSGGNPESGLYFELRYQGQPLDPLKWMSLK